MMYTFPSCLAFADRSVNPSVPVCSNCVSPRSSRLKACVHVHVYVYVYVSVCVLSVSMCPSASTSTFRFAGIQSGVRCGTRVRTLTLCILGCTAQNEGVDGVFVIWVFGVVDAGIFPHEVNHELYMVVFQVYFRPHDQWQCTWTQPRSNN